MANALRLNGFWNSHPAYERVVHKTGRDSAIYFSKTIGKPYARLFQQWGKPDTAAHYLSEAINMFQEMDMHWDLAQAEEVRRALLSMDGR